MLVVIDANIWIAELALNSGLGAAVRFYLRQRAATLVLPEVVRREVEHHLRDKLQTHIDRIGAEYRQLLGVFGQLKELVLPGEADITTRIDGLFGSVGVPVREVPFDIDAARSSLDKVLEKKPPSHKSQQFKDGVIWAHCAQLVREDEVYLVTNDKAFYKNGAYEAGLAPNLLAEVSGHHAFHLVPELRSLLGALQEPIAWSSGLLAEAHSQAHGRAWQNLLDRSGFSRADLLDAAADFYATESPDFLFVEFSLTFRCPDTANRGRADALLRVRGDGAFEPSAGRFFSLGRLGESLQYREDEQDRTFTNHVARVGPIVIGHKTVQHHIRHPLSLKNDTGNPPD